MSDLLTIDDLHVYYSSAHILQGVNLSQTGGVLGLLGRNGMGKTTLARAIMGLVPTSAGEVRLNGEPVTHRPPHEVARHGVGYVPQGREIFPSLTVDEHLQMLGRQSRRSQNAWTIADIHELFPRLHERRHVGGGNLSGGEQQMLAIGRALLTNPSLLIMDEPSEGLAPVIVEPLIDKLKALANAGMAILLIEQNLKMAIEIAEELVIMQTGYVGDRISTTELERNKELQQELLGVTMRA